MGNLRETVNLDRRDESQGDLSLDDLLDELNEGGFGGENVDYWEEDADDDDIDLWKEAGIGDWLKHPIKSVQEYINPTHDVLKRVNGPDPDLLKKTKKAYIDLMLLKLRDLDLRTNGNETMESLVDNALGPVESFKRDDTDNENIKFLHKQLQDFQQEVYAIRNSLARTIKVLKNYRNNPSPTLHGHISF